MTSPRRAPHTPARGEPDGWLQSRSQPARPTSFSSSPPSRGSPRPTGPRRPSPGPADSPAARAAPSRACRPPPDPTRTPSPFRRCGPTVGRRPARSTPGPLPPRIGRDACPRTGTVSPHRVAVSAWFRRRPCPPLPFPQDRAATATRRPPPITSPPVWLCSAPVPRARPRSGSFREGRPTRRSEANPTAPVPGVTVRPPPVHNGAAPCGTAPRRGVHTRTVALFGASGPSRAPGGPATRARRTKPIRGAERSQSRRRAKPIRRADRSQSPAPSEANPPAPSEANPRRRAGLGRECPAWDRPSPTCQRPPHIIVIRRSRVLRFRGVARDHPPPTSVCPTSPSDRPIGSPPPPVGEGTRHRPTRHSRDGAIDQPRRRRVTSEVPGSGRSAASPGRLPPTPAAVTLRHRPETPRDRPSPDGSADVPWSCIP